MEPPTMINPPPSLKIMEPSTMINPWSFIGKVYTILSLQLLATIGIGATVRLVTSISNLLLKTHVGLVLCIIIIVMPFVVLIIRKLLCLEHSKPVNYLFIVSLAFQVGITCCVYSTPGLVILESVCLSAVAFVTLTFYTLWASLRGYEFSLLWRHVLVEAMICMIVYGLIQIVCPLGKASVMISGALGSIVFCGYALYNTHRQIKKSHSEDNDYIFAAVSLYLDILNLFVRLIDHLRRFCCGGGGGGGDGDGGCCRGGGSSSSHHHVHCWFCCDIDIEEGCRGSCAECLCECCCESLMS